MGYAENIIERYKKICALAEHGTEGEADNAKRMKVKMENKHPGINEQAFPPKNKKGMFDFSDLGGFDDSDLFRRRNTDRTSAGWEMFTEKAGDFFSKVKDFTFNAMSIQRAKDIAKDIKFRSRENKHNVSITCTINHDTLDEVESMSHEEKFAFLEQAAQEFADSLEQFLYEDDGEQY
jgi:hypothetical protein